MLISKPHWLSFGALFFDSSHANIFVPIALIAIFAPTYHFYDHTWTGIARWRCLRNTIIVHAWKMVSQSNGFFMIISAKTTAKLCHITPKTAQAIHREIKELYGIRYVTFYHLADFLGLPVEYLERYYHLQLYANDPAKMVRLKEYVKLGPIPTKEEKRSKKE